MIGSGSGCLDEGTVVAFLGGSLPAAGRAAVEEHIAGCATCAELTTWAAVDFASRSQATGREGRAFIGQLAPGARVDRYQVLGAVGRGAMGEVYAAYHPDLDRRIALKVVTAAGPGGGERAVRLLREARAVARLSHPNVVNVHDAGIVDGGLYIAMEFIDGQTIDAWLRSARRDWREVVDVFLAAGRGLAAAHAAGVVHRDFKPQNVMVGRDGGVRVTDFGLARLADEVAGDQAPRDAGWRPAAAAPASVTKTGAVLGTPAYMAPEQFEGAAVDARADQFSFCVALHEALYGARPALAHLQSPAPEAAPNDAVQSSPPGRLRSVIHRGLARDRAQRYPSMNDLLRALDRCRTKLRPRALVVAAGLAGALLLLGGWRLGHHRAVTCDVPTSRLATVWSGQDDTRRQSIRRAFLASGRPSAEASWRAVSAAFDEHVGRWARMYVESCEATNVRGEQSSDILDLRTSCLNESLDELRALTEALATADSVAIANASTAARNLTPMSRCADLDLLRSAVPLPRDPATLREVQRLRAELRMLRAQADLGSRLAGATKAEALRSEVEAVAYKPLLAELLTLIGLGRAYSAPIKAEQALEEALLFAEGSGDRETAARAASLLTYVVGFQLGRSTEGKRWARIGDAILDGQKGNNDRLRGWIANDLGVVLDFEGECDRARVSHERAIALKARALGESHPDVAVSLQNLTNALSCLGRFEDAVEVGNRAVAIIEKTPDLDNFSVGGCYVNRGRALLKLGRYADAHADFTRAKEAFDAEPTIVARFVAEPLHGLGEIRLAQGRVREAIAYLERALRIREAHEPAPTLIAETRFALARALRAGGRDRRRARSLAIAARDAYESKGRPEAREVAAWLAGY